MLQSAGKEDTLQALNSLHSEPPFLAQFSTGHAGTPVYGAVQWTTEGKQLGRALRNEIYVSMEQIPSLANWVSMQALVTSTLERCRG